MGLNARSCCAGLRRERVRAQPEIPWAIVHYAPVCAPHCCKLQQEQIACCGKFCFGVMPLPFTLCPAMRFVARVEGRLGLARLDAARKFDACVYLNCSRIELRAGTRRHACRSPYRLGCRLCLFSQRNNTDCKRTRRTVASEEKRPDCMLSSKPARCVVFRASRPALALVGERGAVAGRRSSDGASTVSSFPALVLQ